MPDRQPERLGNGIRTDRESRAYTSGLGELLNTSGEIFAENSNGSETTFARMREERTAAVQAIIDSAEKKKMIVAGPGTGKTFLFKKLAESAGGNCLAITFINNLADDLRVELNSLADSRTFHSLCKSLLHRLPASGVTNEFSYFPKLPKIIESDSRILSTGAKDFDDPFQRMLESDLRIQFYIERSDYYDAVSPNDMVYRVVHLLSNDPTKIPRYDLVLVDEYQDFNQLEVALIDILASENEVVIVGDDDQALYVLKHASAEFLRARYNSGIYSAFPLPYCSRCPFPVVQATKQLIEGASRAGLLKNRLNKPFECFLPEKELDSRENPHLIEVCCSVDRKDAPYMSRYIGKAMQEVVSAGYMPVQGTSTYDFLIAGRGDLIKGVHEHLSSTLDSNQFQLEYRQRSDHELTICDGFLELINKEESNIGWRTLLEFESKKTREDIVNQTGGRESTIYSLIPNSIKQHHEKTLSLLKNIREGISITITDERWLEDNCFAKIEQIRELIRPPKEAVEHDPELGKYRIMFSTFMGCKGLSANYVFLAGLNDGVIPHDPRRPTDNEVCQLLVGLTRTRKRCYLLWAKNLRGSRYNRSLFISWLNASFLQTESIDRNYWQIKDTKL